MIRLMRTLMRLWAVLSLLAAMGLQAQQSPADRQSAQDQPPVIRVDVDLVRVAASATQHGVPVAGLTKDDFRIRDPGSI